MSRESRSELEQLGERIAEQAAHFDAAMHRLLTDLRTFDAQGGWYAQGALSCAHWLAWRVGWDLVTARERVRVASKLAEFPLIDDALRRGEVSYSKVRAMVRVATPANEALLLDSARLMTASHLENLCRKYALVQRHGQDPHPLTDEQRRFVRRRDTEDGMVKIEAVLHPEEAEMIWTMLNHAAADLAALPVDHSLIQSRPIDAQPAEPRSAPPRSAASDPADAIPTHPLSAHLYSPHSLSPHPVRSDARQADDSAESAATSSSAFAPEPAQSQRPCGDSAETAALSDFDPEPAQSQRPCGDSAETAVLSDFDLEPAQSQCPCGDSAETAALSDFDLEPAQSQRPCGDSAETAVLSDFDPEPPHDPHAVGDSAGSAAASAADSEPAQSPHAVGDSAGSAVAFAADSELAQSLHAVGDSAGSAADSEPPHDPHAVGDSAGSAAVTEHTRSGEPPRMLRQREGATKRAFNRADALVSLAQVYLRGDRPQRAPIELVVAVPLWSLQRRADDPASSSTGETAASRWGSRSEMDVSNQGPPSEMAEPICSTRSGAGRLVSNDRVSRVDPLDPVEVGEVGASFITSETARRLGCDASVVEVIEDEHGTPLSVGRKRRTIAGALKRALRKRDTSCTYPGCTHRLFLEGHHIRHWADGGPTSLDNAALLCSFHHRYVHEYGYTIELGPDQRPQFRDPHGRLITAAPTRPGSPHPGSPQPDSPHAGPLHAGSPELGWPWIRATNAPLAINASTIACEWDGRPVNYSAVVDYLVRADGLQ
jgi:hypothetical protein